MSTQLLLQLQRATVSTFEDLGFLLPSPGVDDEQAEAQLAWRARVAFKGPVDGWLEVGVSDEIASQLASNMLGTHLNVDAAMKRDALGEMANVICGNLVPELGGPVDIFDLGAPELSSVDTQDAVRHPGAVILEMGVDRGRAELALVVESGSSTGDAA